MHRLCSAVTAAATATTVLVGCAVTDSTILTDQWRAWAVATLTDLADRGPSGVVFAEALPAPRLDLTAMALTALAAAEGTRTDPLDDHVDDLLAAWPDTAPLVPGPDGVARLQQTHHTLAALRATGRTADLGPRRAAALDLDAVEPDGGSSAVAHALLVARIEAELADPGAGAPPGSARVVPACAEAVDPGTAGALAELAALTGSTCVLPAEVVAAAAGALAGLAARTVDGRLDPSDLAVTLPHELHGYTHLAGLGVVDRERVATVVRAAVATAEDDPRVAIRQIGQAGVATLVDVARFDEPVPSRSPLVAELHRTVRWRGALADIPSTTLTEDSVLGLHALALLDVVELDDRAVQPVPSRLERGLRWPVVNGLDLEGAAVDVETAAVLRDGGPLSALELAVLLDRAEDACAPDLMRAVERSLTGPAVPPDALAPIGSAPAAFVAEAARSCDEPIAAGLVGQVERALDLTSRTGGLHGLGPSGPADLISTWNGLETACQLGRRPAVDRAAITALVDREIPAGTFDAEVTATRLYSALRIDDLVRNGCSPPWWRSSR